MVTQGEEWSAVEYSGPLLAVATATNTVCRIHERLLNWVAPWVFFKAMNEHSESTLSIAACSTAAKIALVGQPA